MTGHTLAAGVLGILLVAFLVMAEETGPATPPRQFVIHPIGTVHKIGPETVIELDAKYRDGLLGLQDFSHAWILYWFDRNDTPARRAVLRVHPRGDPKNPLTGVFATRSPVRPTLVALSLCRIQKIEGHRIWVQDIDALDGTPVIDIKPYLPGYDTAEGAQVPSWVGGAEKRR